VPAWLYPDEVSYVRAPQLKSRTTFG
jgi:hypothetical protein